MKNETEDEIKEIELVEDTKELLTKNKDAVCETSEIEETIEKMPDETLVMVTKTINSPITITAIQEVNEDLIKGL